MPVFTIAVSRGMSILGNDSDVKAVPQFVNNYFFGCLSNSKKELLYGGKGSIIEIATPIY